jgi:hypothetical protein
MSSDPDAAEIYVDGKVVSNSPATLKLPAGAHTVILKSQGFADYSRKSPSIPERKRNARNRTRKVGVASLAPKLIL